MKKRMISAVLCLAMAAAIPVSGFAAGAASAPAAVGSRRTVDSPDDFSWDNANVYFLMTDRFCNGNTDNDHSYGRTLDQNGNPISGWDTCPTTFHGGDFAGVTEKIDDGYFDDLGVNAIWISAPYEQIHGYTDIGENNMNYAHYGYHGYYALDYTETDANFGTKQEFKEMVDTAHEHGIRVVLDVVMNHCGYNNVKDMMEFNYGAFSNSAGAESYLYKINNVGGYHNCINYNSSAADWGRWWGSDWIRAGLPGYSTNNGSELTQNLASLPDFRTESTANVSVPQFLQFKWQQEGTYDEKMAKYSGLGTVSDYLTTWIAEWVENYGVDGFRCDTAKHVELASWQKLKTKCSAALNTWRQNHPGSYGADWDEDFWMTGEYWGHGLSKDAYYSSGFDSMINFSFSGRSIDGASSLNGVYQSYANAINSDPDFNVLTYISSHDTNLARSSDLYYQGTSLMLLPGGVQIYYGDESNRGLVSNMSFDGNGGSGHVLRSNMNWDSINQSVLEHWQKVGKFRSNHVAVGAGEHRQISAYNSSTGYTFSRTYDDGETADNVICTVGAPKNTFINVDVSSIFANGTVVTNEYDDTTEVVQNGKVRFFTGSQGVILIAVPASSISMSLKNCEREFFDSQTVTVSLRGADYAMVSVNGGSQFRVTNGQTFEIGNDIPVGTTFTVTMTASNSEDTLGKTFTFKKKDPDAITKIYFDNSGYSWSAVNAYVYYETSGTAVFNRAWPGEAMTYDDATGYYVYEVPEELAANGLVIFNNGSVQYPAQNETGLALNGKTKLLTNRTDWQNYTPVDRRVLIGDVNLDGRVDVRDATEVQRHSASIVSLTDKALTAADADKNGTVTVTDATLIQKYAAHVTVSGNSCGEYVMPADPPSTTRTIYFDNSRYNASNPCIYVWKYGTTDCMVAWPGTRMTGAGNQIYSYTCPKEYNCCIFLDGSNKLTGDLTNIPYLNAKYIKDTGWVNAD